ncbi:MAG: hypothetical protein IPM54_42385 [Polyangiaceae bacterium]|nr:hypothetical protein [Polyangiaceae bacterium]
MNILNSKHRAFVGMCFAALVVEACGGAPATSRGSAVLEFPGRDVLGAIAAKPVGKVSMRKTADAVDAWTIESAPEADKGQEAWTPGNSWETMFEEVAKAKAPKARLTRAMACVAHELGRFYLEKKSEPDDGLRRFMTGGCGNFVPDVGGGYLVDEVPADVSDEDLLKNAGPNIRQALGKSLGGNPDLVGFWFGRKDKQIVAYVVQAREEATIKPFSLTPDERGEVVIEGQVLQPTQYFNAYVNKGATAVVKCEIDMSMVRPNFRIICPIDAQDDTAWIQLLSVPPKRALGSVFAQALVRKEANVSPKYAAIRYGDAAPASTPENFTTTVIQNLNKARKEAGLSELTLAREQSKTAAAVAPHYFTSMFDENPNPGQVDTIALALMAGWDVKGMIRDAQMVSTTAATLDVSRWLTSALEMPIGRHTLFDPNIEQLALGPMIMQDQGMLGSVAVGYRFHHGADHADDEQYLLSRVMQTRKRLNLSPPKRLGGVDAILNEELMRVHQSKQSPVDAMNAVLQRSVESFQQSMRGYAIQTTSLEELTLPDEVLRQPTLHLDIGVTHFKPEDGAWAQYAIIVVYAN